MTLKSWKIHRILMHVLNNSNHGTVHDNLILYSYSHIFQSLFSWELIFHSYSECGIDVGEIKIIAYVAQLKWIEHKPSETMSNAYELVKHWDDKKWEPVAIQTLIQSCMPEKGPKFKLVNDLLRGRNVVLFGHKSHYYGEIATVADTQQLDTNGRVHSTYKKYIENFT